MQPMMAHAALGLSQGLQLMVAADAAAAKSNSVDAANTRTTLCVVECMMSKAG